MNSVDRLEHRITIRDGLSLFAAEFPVSPALESRKGHLPVICLPGLSRNSRDFDGFAERVRTHAQKPRRVVSIDYRGRGLSDWDPDPRRYTVPVETGDVVEICGALGIDAAIFVGTSRGGLILHHLPEIAPGLSRANILNDIGPTIEIGGLLAIARYLNQESRYATWRSAAIALKMLHGPAFPALATADWDDMARCLYREQEGVIVPDYDPALVAPLKTLTEDTPLASLFSDLWSLFDRLSGKPLMTIRGETSTLLGEETVLAMGRRHGDMVHLTAAGQGHAPLLHLPGVIEPVQRFLDTLD